MIPVMVRACQLDGRENDFSSNQSEAIDFIDAEHDTLAENELAGVVGIPRLGNVSALQSRGPCPFTGKGWRLQRTGFAAGLSHGMEEAPINSRRY
jgi:hypothetical protein